MAVIFGVISLAMAAIFWNQRILAMSIIFIGMILSLLMFWHHASDILNINL